MCCPCRGLSGWTKPAPMRPRFCSSDSPQPRPASCFRFRLLTLIVNLGQRHVHSKALTPARRLVPTRTRTVDTTTTTRRRGFNSATPSGRNTRADGAHRARNDRHLQPQEHIRKGREHGAFRQRGILRAEEASSNLGGLALGMTVGPDLSRDARSNVSLDGRHRVRGE